MSDKDITIVDIYNLENEWKDYPRQFKQASDELADAQETLRNKKAYLKFKRSKISTEYRQGHREQKGKDDKVIKLTDKAITDLLDSDEEIYELEVEVIKCQKDVDICTSFYEAMRAKKYGLQDAVKLYLGDYFSNPHVDVSDNNAVEYRKKMEAVDKEISEEEDVNEVKNRRRRRRIE